MDRDIAAFDVAIALRGGVAARRLLLVARGGVPSDVSDEAGLLEALPHPEIRCRRRMVTRRWALAEAVGAG
jgi:hypothetical protein